MDPADGLLGSVSVIESVGEATDLLGHTDALAEELLMAEVAVLRAEKPDLVAELDQYFSVVLGNVVRFACSLTESSDLLTRISHSDSQVCNLCASDVNLRCIPLHRLHFVFASSLAVNYS